MGMMPRLNLSTTTPQPGPSWPDSDDLAGTPLFVGRLPLRRVRVMLDVPAAIEGSGDSRGPDAKLLEGLLALDLIECLRYSDTGPPEDVSRRTISAFGEVAIGWAVLDPYEPDRGYRPVRWSLTGHNLTRAAVIGNASDCAASDDSTDAYADLAPGAGAECRKADVLAAQVAEAFGADLFVTNRPYLHRMTWHPVDGVTFCTVRQALAVLGLYLRSQGRFVIANELDRRTTCGMNRGLFYWVGTRELLPAAWRWFAACVQEANALGDDNLIFLGQSVLKRVQRALQVRDEVHVALNRRQDNDTADNAASAFDEVMLLLMGATDATARVAHLLLGVTGPPRRAGWQSRTWLAEVASIERPLSEVFKPGTDHSHTLTILRTLRNTIHGEALSTLRVSTGLRRERTLLALPSGQQGDLEAAIKTLGGTALWGIEPAVSGPMYADPGVLLELLLPRVLSMLNRIMEATPVERFRHVRLQPHDGGPPADDQNFNEATCRSIRWQLGL